MSSSPVVNNTVEQFSLKGIFNRFYHFKFFGFYAFLDSFVNILSFYRSEEPVKSQYTNCLCSSWNESSSLSPSSDPWCKQFNWNTRNLTQEFHFNLVYFESFWIHLSLTTDYRQITEIRWYWTCPVFVTENNIRVSQVLPTPHLTSTTLFMGLS